MDENDTNKNDVIKKRSKKKKLHWVYVKIGTRIVDVKKVVISADDDWNHISEHTKRSSHIETESKRNKEVWNWATGGKSVSKQQVTTSTKQTTKFVYRSEPKIVSQRGRPSQKSKSTLQPTLPKIVRSSPTPSPTGRLANYSSPTAASVRKNNAPKAIESPKKGKKYIPKRNNNSVKLNPIDDSNLIANKKRKTSKDRKINLDKHNKVDKQKLSNGHLEGNTEENITQTNEDENKEIVDEGFSSDYSGAGKRSSSDTSSGDSTPSDGESKVTNTPQDKSKHCKPRSNSLPRNNRSVTNQFKRASHIIRLTNRFKFEAQNDRNPTTNRALNEGNRRITLEMTEVVDMDLKDEIHLQKVQNANNDEELDKGNQNMMSAIESESIRLREVNIMHALDELRSEELLHIVL